MKKFLVLLGMFLFPTIVFGLSSEVTINGVDSYHLEDYSDTDITCEGLVCTLAGGKVKVDYNDEDTTVITLNNYTGKGIYFDTTTDLEIVVKGNNTINCNIDANENDHNNYYGIYSSGSLKVSGTGTLTINNSNESFVVNGENLYFNSNVNINNTGEDGDAVYANTVYVLGGKLNIKNGGSSITCSGSFSLENGTVKINRSYNGIVTNDKVNVKKGNLNIDTKAIGIYAINDITVDGGKVVVKVDGPSETGWGAIGTPGNININGGTVDVEVRSDNMFPMNIIINGEYVRKINVAENMYIVPNGYSSQNREASFDVPATVLFLGDSNTTVDVVSEEFVINNLDKHLVITDQNPSVNPKTLDNVVYYMFLGLISICSMFILSKKVTK